MTVLFTTSSFQVAYATPYDSSIQVPRSGTNIYLRFNGYLDTSTIRNAISFVPEIPGHFYGIEQGTTQVNYFPDSQLIADTTYSVSVSTSLRAQGGYPLPAPYRFSFKTGSH